MCLVTYPANCGRNARRLCAMMLFALATLPSADSTADVVLIHRLNGEPLTTKPCFRALVRLPETAALAKADLSKMKIAVDGKPALAFWQRFRSLSSEGSRKTRVALILIDASGTMDELGFRAAQQAAKLYVSDLDPNLDAVAIAPFGSSRVAQTIRSATFHRTRIDAEAAIDALILPQRSSNTALYSAVVEGINLLEQAGQIRLQR